MEIHYQRRHFAKLLGLTGTELTAADESTDARIFTLKELPWQELAFDSTRDALKDYIEKYLTT